MESNGHILNTDKFEFYSRNGEIYRALLINPIIDGYRNGARWESPDTPHFRDSLNSKFQSFMEIR